MSDSFHLQKNTQERLKKCRFILRLKKTKFLLNQFFQTMYNRRNKTMQRQRQLAKESKKKDASKQLISKLYFSRTQQNYLKIYGNDSHYVLELGELMTKVDKKKLMKIIQQVKQTNTVFRKYLDSKHIVKLSIENVAEFESTLQAQNRKNIQNNLSIKSDSSIKHLNNDIIRIGFMMILEKLTNDKLNSFINQTKYLSQIIQRERDNLSKLGYEYLGVENAHKLRNINEEIKVEQKESGKFKLIGHKIRQQTSTIYEVQKYLNSIILK